jgi:predicted GIY-YIG superfamily endonuclease
MYVIYALIDPRDNTVHYVGQTNDVYARFQQHIRCDGSSFTKNAWILELRAANKMVIMETLQEAETYQEALEREAYWIKHFEMLREPLSNATHRTSLKKVKKDQLKAVSQVASQALLAIEEAKTRAAILVEKQAVLPVQPVKEASTKGICTSEEETLIIKTALDLKNEGVKVTREAIKQKLKWNNAKHPAIKAVCDKHGIAMR